MRIPFIILGLICIGIAVWFGGPMTGWGPLSTPWIQLTILGVIYGVLLIVFLVRLRRRRRRAAELEEAIVPQVVEGDAKVLSEKMTGALATLKKSGGASYLYDLPWYVIIGPPGAGKTTALANSGIEFPLEGKEGGVVEGFGGTRYTDWWFAEDAVLIDTAGRYTTQDSDAEADSKSWTAFLGLLKKARSDQPINGVILAFSVEDMLSTTDEALARHADIVRDRLGEIHEALKVDFPVYVLFTKADLISGFREYFSSFSLSRRKSVWGVTFQTKDRKAATYEDVPAEFDALVSRLSDEIIDRMSEEPDGISRIAIFGLPGQMALLRDNVSTFLRRVFEPTRYKTSAILRGFYFTSGTQEGTPIDQVLGAMSRGTETGAFTPAFMSGKGKSYFLHDLLRRVIFEERDWVSFDKRAVARRRVFTAVSLTLLGLVTAGVLAGLGVSYWQNANLLRTAQADIRQYQTVAATEIQRNIVSDPDLRPILPHLNLLRTLPTGYGQQTDSKIWETFGLGQRKRMSVASEEAYSDALEKMLRPRLILDIERRIPGYLREGDLPLIYRALKVYMLLGGVGGQTDDEAIAAWFEEQWRTEDFASLADFDEREALNEHLSAMLELDNTRDVGIGLDPDVISRARQAIVRMPLAEQAYTLIEGGSELAVLPDWSLSEATAPSGSFVFQSSDGSDLSDLTVPALYTFVGFWEYFFPALDTVAQRLKDDQWVLGEAAERSGFDEQLDALSPALLNRYRQEFRDAWTDMFARIELVSMSADQPAYRALEEFASPTTSPMLLLVNEVTYETRLTRLVDELASLDPEAIATGDFGGMGDEASRRLGQRFISQQGGVARILLESAGNRRGGKNQTRASGEPDNALEPVTRIERDFEEWHLLLEGERGARPIDGVLAQLNQIFQNRAIEARTDPAGALDELRRHLAALRQIKSRLPETLERLIDEAADDLRIEARDATIDEMNAALFSDVSYACSNIVQSFPFAQDGRGLPLGEFGRFFSPGGTIDQYFRTYLINHVNRTRDGTLQVRPDSPLADNLSSAALKQFERAQRIQDAFFASGGDQPSVGIQISLAQAQPALSFLLVRFGDQNIEVDLRGAISESVVWPGNNGTVLMEAASPGRQPSAKQFDRYGNWSIIQFLREASSRSQDGGVMRGTYSMGGIPVPLEIRADARTIPFLMPELSEFQCPQSVD
ncbi:type VI secretion system membrane subunit TssM [Aestuariibius insulae]|uniref:type VI secretion system membrane subunit TssM n=1 Tax=Aestuariibius insulae TaxID=2058287 RepID=UPI00345EB46C